MNKTQKGKNSSTSWMAGESAFCTHWGLIHTHGLSHHFWTKDVLTCISILISLLSPRESFQ